MAHNLFTHPIHLGLGARSVVEPEFTGLEWYEAYSLRHEADGAEGRIVSLYTFTEDWTNWEIHPHGDEVVLCVSGMIILLQEMVDGSKASVTIGPGEYAINPAGAWHTADIAGEATALFITAGLETTHRAR